MKISTNQIQKVTHYTSSSTSQSSSNSKYQNKNRCLRIINTRKNSTVSIERCFSVHRIVCKYVLYTPHGIDPGNPCKNTTMNRITNSNKSNLKEQRKYLLELTHRNGRFFPPIPLSLQ